MFLASLLMIASPFKLIILFILFLFVCVALRANVVAISRLLLQAWPLLLITFVIHAVISSRITAGLAGQAAAPSNFFQGLGPAALFTVRLALMLLTVALLFRLHPMQRYGQAVGRLFARLPFGRRTFAQVELAGTLALRFVPFVRQEAARLRMALSARGEAVAKSRWAGILGARKLLFPLMVSALRRADHVADALTVRGYDPSVAKTSLRVVPVSAVQIAATGLFTLVCLAVPWI
jgi:energy-coupling factor transporter transmembrane protein EcfT